MWRARWYDSNANKGDSTLLALLIDFCCTVYVGQKDWLFQLSLESWIPYRNRILQDVVLNEKSYKISFVTIYIDICHYCAKLIQKLSLLR